jgi:5-methyltetrahydropteroyltriglutamate--homocysteine methyltransferase
MYHATKDTVLPTTIIGSLPRPSWYTVNLGTQPFMDAMTHAAYREQYTDALCCFLKDQEVAGIDICTDGDCRFDSDYGGQNWNSYPPRHMSGFDTGRPRLVSVRGVVFPRGHILHDYQEAKVMPAIVGPVGRGELQYTETWKTAQRLTVKPVKFGTISPDLVALGVEDHYYNDLRERILAISTAINEELKDLAAAGCPAVQIEEPQVHFLRARDLENEILNAPFLLEVFRNTVKGLRDKTEVWAHTCWGNPFQQRMFAEVQSYAPALDAMNELDADVITFESCSSGGIDLEAIGKAITRAKIAIGVIDHHTLQIERAEDVAAHIRRALEHISPERLVICSDCGMGRGGMSRRHAFFKMVAMVQGTNIVRRELGLPEAPCLAADPRLSLVGNASV